MEMNYFKKTGKDDGSRMYACGTAFIPVRFQRPNFRHK